MSRRTKRVRLTTTWANALGESYPVGTACVVMTEAELRAWIRANRDKVRGRPWEGWKARKDRWKRAWKSVPGRKDMKPRDYPERIVMLGGAPRFIAVEDLEADRSTTGR